MGGWEMEDTGTIWRSGRWSRRRMIAGGSAVAGTSALLLAGCSSRSRQSGTTTSASGGIKRGGTINAFITSPSSEDLDPYGVRSESASTQPMMALVYNGLLRLKLGA